MVLSRALSLAAVTLVVGSCAIGGAEAQENLDAGKSPSQIFAGTCTACHKSARGLLKTVAPGSLQGFLRQHYTTSPEMAGVLASYLISNGAADTRYGDKKGAKDGREAKSARPEPSSAPAEAERAGHNAKRAARPVETPAAGNPAAEGQVPPAGTGEHEGRKSKRTGKHAKPGIGEEIPKASERPVEPAKEDAAGGQPAKGDAARVEPAKPEAAKPETSKPEAANSGEAGKPVDNAKAVASPAQSSANAGPAKEPVNEALPPSLRPDPVPPVTPAPAAAAPVPARPAAASAPTPTASSTPLSVTVSAPPPPAQPATPPDPPISR